MTSVPESGEELQQLNDQTEANIRKAIRFWRHPSLTAIPSDQKRQYLNERGVTDDEIHTAWERIAESEIPVNSDLKPSSDAGGKTEQPHTAPLPADAFPNQRAPASSLPPYAPNYTPPPPQYYGQHAGQEEEDGPLSLVQGASLVTLGGMIGLTAAAASRWLNGGDFEVFPGPKFPTDVTDQRSAFLQRLEAEQQEEEDMIDEEEDGFLESSQPDDEVVVAVVQEKLLQQVEVIAENLKLSAEAQEKILKRMTSNGSSITDQSMNLLRSQETKSQSDKEYSQSDMLKLWVELVEIRAELRSFNNMSTLRGTSVELEEQATRTMGNLEECIEQINTRVGVTRIKETASAGANQALPASASPVHQLSETSGESQAEETVEVIAHTLVASIGALARRNDPNALRVGSQLLFLYIVNLSGKPDNPRYRKIFTSNESFKNVEILKGAKELLYAVGFEEKGGCLEWLPNTSPDEEALAMEKLKQASAALGILKSGKMSNDLIESALAVLSPAPAEETIHGISTSADDPGNINLQIKD